MAELYEPGQVVNGYRIVTLINSGAQALSFSATAPSGEKVFLKEYTSPSIRVPWYKAFVAHQAEMKQRIETTPCRQFCYRFLGGFEFRRCYHQVFEYLDRSHSLGQILTKVQRSPTAVPWVQRELMAKVLAAGIAQLHAAKVVHADLKPDNVMLITDHSIGMKYRLKLIDMDLSVFTDKKAPWHGHEGYFGTPGYFSPEHLTGKVPQPASDVFTLGLMLYQLLGRGHPYLFDDIDQYRPAYLGYKAVRPRLLGVPQAPARGEDVEAILYQCLHPDPAQRPTAKDVHRALTGDRTAAAASPAGGAAHPPPVPMSLPDAEPDSLPLADDLPPGPRGSRTVSPPAPRRSEPAPAPPAAAYPANGRLTLLGPEGGKLSVGARLVLGRTILSRFGAGANYAAEQQFVVDRDGDEWVVEPVAGAPNDTMHNGELLAARAVLSDGDTLGIGRAAKKKTVLELTVALHPDGA